jgi:cytochrome c
VSYKLSTTAFTVLALVIIAMHPASADVSKGAQIARQCCANCHVIGGNSTGAAPQGPPSFPTIARSGLTTDQLSAFLSHPHGAMPDLALTRTEIDDLIGYIGTLR